MRPARPTILVTIVAVVCASLAGCTGAPDPRAWAAAVCTVLAPWRTEIGALTTHTQQQMSAATMPAQAKENLVRLFSGAEAASEQARVGVDAAGVPDVENGRQVADSFAGALGAMRDAYGRARGGIAALATTPADTFYAGVRQVVQRLNDEYERSGLDTSRLASPELRQAFDDVPECR